MVAAMDFVIAPLLVLASAGGTDVGLPGAKTVAVARAKIISGENVRLDGDDKHAATANMVNGELVFPVARSVNFVRRRDKPVNVLTEFH